MIRLIQLGIKQEDILTPQWPNTRECDTTYPYSCFSQDVYLNSKHNYFKNRSNFSEVDVAPAKTDKVNKVEK